MMNSKQNELSIKLGTWVASRIEKIETILFLVFIASMCIKVFTDIPVNTLVVLSLVALALAYFFNAFAIINEGNVNPIDVFLNKLVNWACAVGLVGILFRLQNLFNYEVMVIVGCGLLAIALPVIIYRKSKEDALKLFNARYLIRMVLICAIGFMLAFSPAEVLVKNKIIAPPATEEVN